MASQARTLGSRPAILLALWGVLQTRQEGTGWAHERRQSVPPSEVVSSPSMALGTSHCIVLIKKLNNVVVHTLLSNVPRQPVHMVCDLSVCKVSQQHLHSLTAALAGCKEQRSLLLCGEKKNTQKRMY